MFLPVRQFSAFADALFTLRRGCGPLLLNGQHTALQVGMEPVNALEGRFRAAPPLLEAC